MPRVSDKLKLHYKKDSDLVQKILAKTELGSLTFKTCIAGTINTVQMLTMLVVELVYHKVYKQVKFHREIFKFKDGGQIAMDWAFDMPQKTKYLTAKEKRQILNRYND